MIDIVACAVYMNASFGVISYHSLNASRANAPAENVLEPLALQGAFCDD